eukprot:scaffold2238_cov145-Skeletonema_menzelii.AAC.3
MAQTTATTPRFPCVGSNPGGNLTKGVEKKEYTMEMENEEENAHLSLSSTKQPANRTMQSQKKRALTDIDGNALMGSGDSHSKSLAVAKKVKALPLQTTKPLSSEMSAALAAIELDIASVAISPIRKLNLVFRKWLQLKLFEGEHQMRAIELYLEPAHYCSFVRDLGKGGRPIWKMIFLAEYPHFGGVRFLTDRVEEFKGNGLEFAENGGWAATLKLLGYKNPYGKSEKTMLSFFGFQQHCDHRVEVAKKGGKAIFFQDHCHISCWHYFEHVSSLILADFDYAHHFRFAAFIRQTDGWISNK